MTSISKNLCIDKLKNTTKMKPVDVKLNAYINFSKDKDPKSKIGDIVRISKYKNIFAKGYVPNWSEEVFLVKKVKRNVSWIYVISDLKC